jgi:hypothetical protein
MRRHHLFHISFHGFEMTDGIRGEKMDSDLSNPGFPESVKSEWTLSWVLLIRRSHVRIMPGAPIDQSDTGIFNRWIGLG